MNLQVMKNPFDLIYIKRFPVSEQTPKYFENGTEVQLSHLSFESQVTTVNQQAQICSAAKTNKSIQ